MTDKELLIKDLSARLPYNVELNIIIEDSFFANFSDSLKSIDKIFGIVNDEYDIEMVKPYLFPLSSMTEEQREEYNSMVTEELMEIINDEAEIKPEYKYIDWLNAHHFDYRGLIDRDLAIDATNLNIYENDTRR